MAGGVRPNADHTTALLDLAGESGLVYQMYPPAPSFGILFIFRMNERLENLLAELGRESTENSNLTRFASLVEASVLEETGISYRLPDHVYSEESSQW